MFEIRRYTSELADEWNQFIAKSKNGTFLFDRRYMDYHADRFNDHSLLFYLGNRLLAVLPAHASGDTLYSHNGLTYGGLVMSSRLTVVQTMNLFRELNEQLRQEGFRHVSYKMSVINASLGFTIVYRLTKISMRCFMNAMPVLWQGILLRMSSWQARCGGSA